MSRGSKVHDPFEQFSKLSLTLDPWDNSRELAFARRFRCSWVWQSQPAQGGREYELGREKKTKLNGHGLEGLLNFSHYKTHGIPQEQCVLKGNTGVLY